MKRFFTFFSINQVFFIKKTLLKHNFAEILNSMISNNPIMETAPFKEFTSVKVTDNFNALYDVEKTTKENLKSYCQSLIDKIFEVDYLDIPNFINHHFSITKNSLEWLDNFEKLIVINNRIFLDNNKESRLIKIQLYIEAKRCELKKSPESPARPSKKDTNAVSEERYFSFKEVKEKLKSIIAFEEKILYLTHQKYDYQQSVIDFINQNLRQFDELCEKEIERLIEVKKLEEQLEKTPSKSSKKNCFGKKIKINSNLNQFVDVFYQLNREQLIEGKPILDGNTKDFVLMICNNFVDKNGHDISKASVETILRPSKYDKRPKFHNRINVDEII